MALIKSGFAKRNAQMIMEKLGQCDGIVKTCISICPDSRLEKELDGLQKNIADVAGKAEMLSNGDEHIQSSRKSIKSGVNPKVLECEKKIQKLTDYLYDIGRSDLVHEIDDDFDNDFPGDEKAYIRKVNTWCDWRESPLIDKLDNHEWQGYLDLINSSRKPIKSSLDDRLVPYLEEFEEGYSNALVEDPMDSFAGFDTTDARCKTFYETFKSDHNLTDDDINKLENAVVDMWHEADAEID